MFTVFVVAVVMDFRSHYLGFHDSITYSATRVNGLFSEDGLLLIGSFGDLTWVEARPPEWSFNVNSGPAHGIATLANSYTSPQLFFRCGVVYFDHAKTYFVFRSSAHLLVIPYALIGLVTGLWLVLPETLRELPKAFRQKPPQGICAVCGYDLRATPARCPECGTIPRSPLLENEADR